MWKKQDKIGDGEEEMIAESTSAFENADVQIMHSSNQAKGSII